jgi:hypothetical protein
VLNRVVACPAKYHYGFLVFIIFTGLSEWQQPGSTLCPENLSNAIIGFLCATSLVLGVLALLDFIETDRWPWEEDGWVWPWQAWLWKETVFDLGASTSTYVAGNDSLLSYTSPSVAETLRFDSPVQNNTLTNDSGTMMPPPPTISRQSIIFPPTPQLSIGLRSSFLLPPTPAEIHKSGILGESPMPSKFKHFSGHGFATNNKKLKAAAEWSGPTRMSLEAVKKSAVPEKRASEDKADGKGRLMKKVHVVNNDIVQNKFKTHVQDA